MYLTHSTFIGIPCLHIVHDFYGSINGSFSSCIQAIEAAGAIPNLIHLTHDRTVLRAHYERCQGVLLVGGSDVDPASYGEEPHPALGPTDPLQDALELQLIAWAQADSKPVLGICRGMQILNVALGGTLYQDLPDQFVGAVNHRESATYPHWHHLAHPITLAPNCWLADQLGTTQITVNTVHHQALKTVAPGLRVVAYAPDGVIEAVESIDAQFVVGVQCHPETLWDAIDPRWQRVFAEFVHTAQTRRTFLTDARPECRQQ